MGKEKRVLDYYVLCNKLKNVIRTWWKHRDVQKERLESVAEHIFWVQMLAIAMKSEYKYDIDIMKVVFMIAIHELWESIIGDITQFEISKAEKEKMEHEAVHNILKDLVDGDDIEKLFLEFDWHRTKEALFAYHCDKLECDLQCKLYDEETYLKVDKEKYMKNVHDETVIKLFEQNMTWSEMWLTFSQLKYNYDENFMAVSNYALNHKISE
jgi:putative hydrolase of HD superfamily